MRDPLLETSGGDTIGFYEREFYVFSNFSSFAVEWRGRLWMTSEHAYQAAKFMETAPELAERIFNARSSHDAMVIARENMSKARPDWDKVKAEIMYDICRKKLSQHIYIQKKLAQTGNKRLVEDSPKDSFWGWGRDKKGRNELGKVWMRLRDEYLTGEEIM